MIENTVLQVIGSTLLRILVDRGSGLTAAIKCENDRQTAVERVSGIQFLLLLDYIYLFSFQYANIYGTYLSK